VDLTTKTESFTSEDQSWLGSPHGAGDMCASIVLDTALFTAGTHFPDGSLRSGTPLGKVTATGRYGPYNNALATGQEVLAGFLLTPQKMATGGANPGGSLLEHGIVIEANLPIAIDAAGKADVAGRIVFH
jgi:hypothetical protein